MIELHLPLDMYPTFNLENAVCNHGFFMMAPNIWIPSAKTLQRPLRLSNSITSVKVSILHSPIMENSLLVRVHGIDCLSPQDQIAILDQVKRMLRISDKDETDVREFQKMHAMAKERGFGRLFRAPTIFEDFVKTFLLLRCTWKRTLQMAQALCELQSRLYVGSNKGPPKKKKKLGTNLHDACNTKYSVDALSNSHDAYDSRLLIPGNFPTSRELAGVDEILLRDSCKLGDRARFILKFAKKVDSGRLNPDKFDKDLDEATYESIYKKLESIKGFGSFASNTMLMTFGFYQVVPADSETIRHMKEVHGRKKCSSKTVANDVKYIYGKYHKFQCLAFWFELLEGYERKVGKLSSLPRSEYHTVTGSLSHRKL